MRNINCKLHRYVKILTRKILGGIACHKIRNGSRNSIDLRLNCD